MSNYLFNLGLNDKDTKKQLISKADAVMLIADICGDCTLTETIGIYTHKNGERVCENGFKIEVYGISDDTATDIACKLRDVFNQECVVKTKLQNLDTVFI